MKVLFVIPRMGGGGAERVTSLLANALSSKGNQVYIHTMVGGESFYPLSPKIVYSSADAQVNRRNKLTAAFSQMIHLPRSFFSIRRLIKRRCFDIVISFLVAADILVWLCSCSGLRFHHVCSERYEPMIRSPGQLRLLQRIYQKCDLLVCQSKRVAEFYSMVPEKRKTVIPNPVDPTLIPARVAVVHHRVVAVGRLDSQKNFALLIDSIADVKTKLKEVTLDIYGEGPQRMELQEMIDRLGLAHCVTLQGVSSDLLRQIANAALFVMSSDHEGFPNALLEAMAIGLPVISTDFPTGVARELIGAENGVVISVGDRKGLSDAIYSILSDPEQQLTMGKANRQKTEAFYIDRIIDLWIDALEIVLSRET
ncbi:MAG: glycosyltransferase [Saccharofermentanales bacterium]|jgi:GalNAc-alpha-(1->4)-GalNAc-alpha-(1->3)-diNAcBac-PP-undecaprenol alpha-1,4-N-acetyl-D-galactosaminyltransferase